MSSPSDPYDAAIDFVEPAQVSERGHPPSERVRVRRRPARASYQRDVLYTVFDDALVCHVGFVVDDQPYVLPTLHVRIGNFLYLHGDKRNRLLGLVADGRPVCVEATHIDRVMLGRSAFQNSVNYRSAVALGVGRSVEDPEEKERILCALVRRTLPPARLGEVRPLADYEIARTLVVELPLTEASVKMRTGPSVDEARDLDRPVWAGEIPVVTSLGEPIADDKVPAGIGVPDYLRGWAGPPVQVEPAPLGH